jgi:aminoglycoside phosphotransferase (APT) family kinase protein
MRLEDAPDTRTLARLVAGHLGTAPGDVRLRRIPTGKFNTSYFVDGGPCLLVLRIAPPDDRSQVLFYEHRMMRQEPALHALLRQRTDIPVPAVLAHDFGHTAIDRDYLLMERLNGTPLSGHAGLTSATLEDILRAVGRCLRQTHLITGDRHGYVGDHHPMEPQSDWASAFRIMWHLLLDDIERCGGYSPAEAEQMRRLLDRHAAIFDRPVAASLLHMDVWAENILADESGRLTGLIDWDRACWGDPEIEFAVLDYCGIWSPPSGRATGPDRTVRERPRCGRSSTCSTRSRSTS